MARRGHGGAGGLFAEGRKEEIKSDGLPRSSHFECLVQATGVGKTVKKLGKAVPNPVLAGRFKALMASWVTLLAPYVAGELDGSAFSMAQASFAEGLTDTPFGLRLLHLLQQHVVVLTRNATGLSR